LKASQLFGVKMHRLVFRQEGVLQAWVIFVGDDGWEERELVLNSFKGNLDVLFMLSGIAGGGCVGVCYSEVLMVLLEGVVRMLEI